MTLYSGMNNTNGKVITDIDHLRQSVRDILLTPQGSRIARREYGSLLSSLPESVTRQQPATVNADGKVMMPSGGFPSWGYGFAGMYDSGGYIPRGQFGIVGENGPEIVNGPANVTSRRNTAALAAVVAGMMGVAAAPAELPPLHPLALPAKGGEAMVSRAATVPPIYRIEAPTQIIIQTQPGQSAQDIAREVARQLDERERRLKAKARSNYSDQGGYDA